MSVLNPEAIGIKLPAFAGLPAGRERYEVAGGGSQVVKVYAGDVLTLEDRDGDAYAELIHFDLKLKSHTQSLGAKSEGTPTRTIELLHENTSSARKMLRALDAAGLDLSKAEKITFQGYREHGGAEAEFRVEKDGMIIVATPWREAIDPFSQSGPVPIVLSIDRIAAQAKKGGFVPPPPLAEPLIDQQINPGNAFVYEVRAGEYIQVLDVQGRECSDFQAFALKDIEKGLEREIDPTTTRSMTGSLYPKPGNSAKYWNVDQVPLIELVADTVGRHDTFGLACTRRYYEELGYYDHVNCSDNMNKELAAYQIRPRAGWPAINFFFNTFLDDSHQLGFDDPWSLPGDYVLLRAVTDLVCVSTACPCDIDPANGWQPSEIQLRTYKSNEDFQRSIGWRKTVGRELQQTKETGFHEYFAEMTRDFIEYNGYWLPNSFRDYGALKEYWACRERVAVMDLSPLRKFEVVGPDAEELMQLCVTRDMTKLSTGGVAYTAICFEHGGMIDDGTVFKLGEQNFRLICGCDDSGKWLKAQAEAHQFNVQVRDATDRICNIAVQGRLSLDVLKAFVWTPPLQPRVEELQPFKFTLARINEYNGVPIMVSRTGYTGEQGYEIFCAPKDAEVVFRTVMKAGAPYDITPLGMEALNILRVESGLIFKGYEFCEQTDPFEAGIGFTVPLKTQTADFIGRTALEKRKENPQRVIVGLDLETGIVPSHGDPVFKGQARIGEVTSAVKSPILEKVIAIARVNTEYSEVGNKLEIGVLDGKQKRLEAVIVPYPHFDPTKERVKGNYA